MDHQIAVEGGIAAVFWSEQDCSAIDWWSLKLLDLSCIRSSWFAEQKMCCNALDVTLVPEMLPNYL